MGDGGISPVEESEASILDEDVTVMEISVVDRFGYPDSRQI
jgi:hypothetical protein